MGKIFIYAGLLLIIVGLLVTYGPQIPLIGKLPGDIVVEKKSFRFYFPITTCILLSLLFTLIVHILKRR